MKNEYSKPYKTAKLIKEIMRRSSSKDLKKFKEIVSEKDDGSFVSKMEKFLRNLGLMRQLH